MFEAVYCSSVFTHLSEAMHYMWLRELVRVLKPDGVLIFTAQGDRMRDRLLPDELRVYEEGRLVVRQSKVEGSRTFSAYQSPAFVMKQLIPSTPGLELIAHDTERPLAAIQDIWVVRKK
jgi:ubiquinone/menaquinone biosynthesis C-methylase UbiE